MKMSNPVLKKMGKAGLAEGSVAASYKGIALKTVLFAALTMLSGIAAYVTMSFMPEISATFILTVCIVCPIVALICGFIAAFKPDTTKITGTLYALFQGFAIGFISSIFDASYSGVVFAALLATFGTFFVMAILYSTGIIRVGNRFRRFIMTALPAILIVNLIMWVLSLFSSSLSNAFYGNGWLSIGISVIMIIFASIMLLFDFDQATSIVEGGLDRKYEWTVAFGLTLTLIWLYLEFLELFAKISSRNK